LNVPVEIGQKKYDFHNRPARLATVRYLLNNSDLIYCSTEPLARRLKEVHGADSPVQAGKIYCSGEVKVLPREKSQVRKIGYMGFDHAHDFKIAIPAVVEVLQNHPEIQFELFGSIPKPKELGAFGSRINVIAPVPDYETFMERLADLSWDIGIAPLAATRFNEVKANTKWVEYTSVGAAVIATGGTIYDDCCSKGCGLLAKTKQDWIDQFESLITDPKHRYNIVVSAQKRLEKEYSLDSLQKQIIEIVRRAGSGVKRRG